MIINKAILVYFSPTGTSAKNARTFATGMGIPFEEFDLTGLKEWNNFMRLFAENELLVTGLPVYGGRLPGDIEPFFPA